MQEQSQAFAKDQEIAHMPTRKHTHGNTRNWHRTLTATRQDEQFMQGSLPQRDDCKQVRTLKYYITKQIPNTKPAHVYNGSNRVWSRGNATASLHSTTQ